LSREYWLEATEETEKHLEMLESRADRMDSIDSYNLEGEIAYFEASPTGFKDLIYSKAETEYGQQPIRSFFGEQYTEEPETESSPESLKAAEKALADGSGTEELSYQESLEASKGWETDAKGIDRTL